MYIKVTNLVQESGHVDYKGLDINLIKPGSAIYNFEGNETAFFYDGEVVANHDIHVIDEYIYRDFYNQLLERPVESSITPEERITELQLELERVKTEQAQANAELFEILFMSQM